MAEAMRIIYGTQRGLENAIERYAAGGWVVTSTESVPRGKERKKYIYTATITKENVNLNNNENESTT